MFGNDYHYKGGDEFEKENSFFWLGGVSKSGFGNEKIKQMTTKPTTVQLIQEFNCWKQ